MQALLPRTVRILGFALLAVSLAPRAALGSGGRSTHGGSAAGPARFIENLGQWPADVQFAAAVGGMAARAECGGLGFHSIARDGSGHYVRLVFDGAASNLQPHGVDPLPGLHHYYLGNDPARWQRNARAFAAVEYRGVYPGVDLVLHARQGRPKYDLLLAPGVDPATVRVRWLGAEHVDAGHEGVGLLLGSAGLQELPIVAWQPRRNAGDRPVRAAWIRTQDDVLTLRVEDADPALALVIDPELLWSTYLGASSTGGNGDWATKPAVDANGDVYVLGRTDGYDFPVTPGAFHVQPGTREWCTLTKLGGSDGRGIYSIVFGGSDVERGNDLAVDSLGRCTVVGWTHSSDFPVVAGSFDTLINNPDPAFALRFSATGEQLDYSTVFEPAQGGCVAHACALRPDGSVVVGGTLYGQGFPFTLPPLGVVGSDTWAASSFLLELDVSGSNVRWARQIGSTAGLFRIALLKSGEIQTAGIVRSQAFPTTPGVFMPTKPLAWGTILFFTRLSPAADSIVWSTFLGGSHGNENDQVDYLAIDDFGTVTFAGVTNTDTFPTTPGTLLPNAPGPQEYGSVLCRIAADGSSLIYSTFTTPLPNWGGFGYPFVDASGVVTAAGSTASYFAATPGALDPSWGPGDQYQVVKVDPYGRRLLFLTHVGGAGPRITLGMVATSDGRVTVVGQYAGPGHPTTPGSFQPGYAGGLSDGTATTLYLELTGVSNFGASTPACHGEVRAFALRMPSAGAADFGFYCSAAPENARGVLLLGRPAAVPAFLGGAAIHVALSPAPRMLPVRSDEFGYLETPLALPLGLQPGSVIAAQYLFRNNDDCSGPTRFSASQALRLVIQ